MLASEFVITSYIVAAESPSLLPSVSASAESWHVAMARKLLTIFMEMPLPCGPQWMILLPIASRIGRARSRSPAAAPTMNRLSPRSAWAGERPTAASTKRMPLSASTAPKERLAAGSMVLMSIIIIPARPVSRSPPGPLTTPATSGVFGSMVMTTSAAGISAARLLARAAPLSTSTAI